MNNEIANAKELLGNVRHAAMATVNEDGSPHNTPYFFMCSDDFSRLYWGSHEDSQHSKNILRDGRLFVVLFDSFEQGKGGIYITASKAHQVTGDELGEALKVHNQFRQKYQKSPLDAAYYKEGGQKMYTADVIKVELYSAVRNSKGQIERESRKEMVKEDLVS